MLISVLIVGLFLIQCLLLKGMEQIIPTVKAALSVVFYADAIVVLKGLLGAIICIEKQAKAVDV
jgi:hypothetical protein